MATSPTQPDEKALAALMDRIFADTFMVSDATRRLVLLEDALERHAHAPDAPWADAVQTTMGVDPADVRAVVAWESEAMRALAGAGMREHLQELRQRIDTAPKLMLYVPLPLPIERIGEIARWCREETSPTLLLDVRVDSAAAGGCLFAWKGVLHDFSFTHFLAAHEAAYAQMVERVMARAAPAVP